MTKAGATWPYGKDPMDTNIRIAPTYPSLEDLAVAADLFTVCVRLVSAEMLLNNPGLQTQLREDLGLNEEEEVLEQAASGQESAGASMM
jgi:hypothetical protein